jgi:LPS-assembly protein
MEYKFDESNYLTFNTRRNRKIDLTEYYNLVYEYKNDCLIAGIQYKKTYYQDRDLLPTEDLMISITIFPLTTYERKIDR